MGRVMWMSIGDPYLANSACEGRTRPGQRKMRTTKRSRKSEEFPEKFLHSTLHVLYNPPPTRVNPYHTPEFPPDRIESLIINHIHTK